MTEAENGLRKRFIDKAGESHSEMNTADAVRTAKPSVLEPVVLGRTASGTGKELSCRQLRSS